MRHRTAFSAPTRAAIVAATAAAALGAQGSDVERRNPGVLWLEGQHHQNGNSFPDARQNPPGHVTTAGVPVGTLSYVWLPRSVDRRGEDETITGFRAPLGPSSATSAYPATVYVPQFTVHRTRAVATHVEPDAAAMPYLTVAESPLVFTQFGYYEVSVALSNSYTLPVQQQDTVLSLRWSHNDSRLTPDTLNMWGDAYGATYPEPVFGFVDPSGAVTPVSMTGAQPGYLNLTYRRAAPSVQAHSTWGGSATGLTTGSSISTYAAPLATQSGKLGWSVATTPAFFGRTLVPLFNLGPVYAGATPFLGQVLEIDPFDPFVAVLASAGYLLAVDPFGQATGFEFPFAPLGASALGLDIGVEFAQINATFTGIDATTQAAWVRIAR